MKKKIAEFPRRSAIVFLLLAFAVLGCSKDPDESLNFRSANTKNLGSSANDLLSDETFTSLKVEIAYIRGYEPSKAALDELKGFLSTYINKPEGISIVDYPIEDQGEGPFSIAEIIDIENKNRMYYNDGEELSVFILFVNGRSAAEDENKVILGTAYRNTSMVIFEKTIREMAEQSVFVSRSAITSTTLQHEFGHLFGLVDNGSPAQSEHEDSESNSHCNVTGCLMTSSVEFGRGTMDYIKSQQTEKGFHVFDEHCHADLRANGGK